LSLNKSLRRVSSLFLPTHCDRCGKLRFCKYSHINPQFDDPLFESSVDKNSKEWLEIQQFKNSFLCTPCRRDLRNLELALFSNDLRKIEKKSFDKAQ